jgi:lipid-binding SYLF domain-containing protein
MTTTTFLRLIPFFVASAFVVGCSTAPKTSAERAELKDEAQATLNHLKSKDSTLEGLLSRSAGYAIFPTIGKGGLIAGAAYGRGTVYEGGKHIGYADMSQGSVGAQIGGESYSELIIFQTPEALYKFKNNNFTFGANATAVALQAGAAAGAEFKDGVAILMETKGGLMADASLAGQKFHFVPNSVATDQATTMKTSETMTTETKTTTTPPNAR